MSVPERETRKTKPKAFIEPVAGEKKHLIYFCPDQTMQSFYIPARDESGKMIPARLRDGSPKFLNGVPMYIDILCKFTPVLAGNKRNPEDTLCKYELEPEDKQYDDKFAALEKLRKDETSRVMSLEQYETYKNRDAAKFKHENIALRNQVEEQKKIIAELEALKVAATK
jgi:hypothetical protein